MSVLFRSWGAQSRLSLRPEVIVRGKLENGVLGKTVDTLPLSLEESPTS